MDDTNLRLEEKLAYLERHLEELDGLVRELYTRLDAQRAESKRWRDEIDQRFTSLTEERDPADDVPPHWGR